jgi:hypothetical protein
MNKIFFVAALLGGFLTAPAWAQTKVGDWTVEKRAKDTHCNAARGYIEVLSSELAYPPLEGEGKRLKGAAGWGDSASACAVPELRDRHPTPFRISLRFMRTDPPPPGEGKKTSSLRLGFAPAPMQPQLAAAFGVYQRRSERWCRRRSSS